jgi:uncharacterized protein YbjT (DUF2867 family)
MNVIIFGATGMVGQSVLRECLCDPDICSVMAIGRTVSGVRHEKLREIVQADLWHYAAIESELTGFDACFFCLGVSSAGMREAEYAHLTYDLTLAAAGTLCRLNPQMAFIYVSGSGTDSTEQGSSMWARVKGRTENALLRLPFKAAYMFRPGVIRPLHGIRSRTRSYRMLYALLAPVLPLAQRAFPAAIATTDTLGRAMIEVAKHGTAKTYLENADILAVSQSAESRDRGKGRLTNAAS